jgi:hypothetical protein
MRKALLLTLVSIFLVVAPSSAALYQYYQQLGQPLPTIQERAIDAAEVGIFGYKGTKEQNILLEERLRELNGNPGDLGITVVSRYRTTLLSSMTSNQTTIPVASLETFDGDTLTMDLLGGVVYLTIEPGLSREEIIKCTSISAGRFADCTRGLKFSGSDESGSASNRFAHNAGSVVVMSNVHYVYENFLDKQGDQTLYGAITFNVPPISTTTATTTYQIPNWGQVTSTLALYPTLAGNNAFTGTNSFSNTSTFTGTTVVPYSTASSSAASVGLVNDTANAGAATMSTTTKGIAKLSVDPVDSENPIVVGDNDPRLAEVASTTTFTASGTWNKPDGANYVCVELWGAGGSGASVNTASGYASGGGGGAYNKKCYLASDLSSSYSVTIGAGGANVTGNTNGIAGGTTSFGSLLYAYGGAGGLQNGSSAVNGGGGGGQLGSGATSTDNTVPSLGGNPQLDRAGRGGFDQQTTGIYAYQGFYGIGGFWHGGGGGAGNNTAYYKAGGSSIYGGGGGGGTGTGSASGGTGGSSLYAGAGGASASGNGSVGTDGSAPAGGGGGRAGTTGESGDGARGQAIITTHF